jgi:hypothetical protein
MGNSYRRMLAAAVLVVTMSAIVGLVVLSPLVWRDGSSPGPVPEAVPASGEVAEVTAPEPESEPESTTVARQTGAEQVRPLFITRDPAQPVPGAGDIRPLQRPAASKPQPVFVTKGKAKGHEKKGLGSKKAGKHGHHAQGAPGKGHGKGKSKDRDRAPARARG